ncbi:MAG: hypothetical protein HKN04_04075 [Rhodothermaceae bacterium]|nr:hypothetical protein [Rhodothermaceae bacterium]
MMRSRLTLLLLACLLPLSACDTQDPDPNNVQRVFITEVRIVDAPLLRPDGDDWDSLGGNPDIYVELVNATSGNIIESYRDENFSNVGDNDFPLVYDLGMGLPEIEFNSFNGVLAFDMYDEDPQLTKGDDDYMGSTEEFTLRDIIDSGTPQFVSLTSANSDIVIRITLDYD